MGKDYSTSRRLLEKALSSIPDDYALFEVKSKVKSALSKLSEVEKKNGRHQDVVTPLNKWQIEIKERLSNVPVGSAKDRLAAIEQMINLEAAKIDNPKKKDTDENMATILG